MLTVARGCSEGPDRGHHSSQVHAEQLCVLRQGRAGGGHRSRTAEPHPLHQTRWRQG